MAAEIARMKAEDAKEEKAWRAELKNSDGHVEARMGAEKLLTFEELAREQEARAQFRLDAAADRAEAAAFFCSAHEK